MVLLLSLAADTSALLRLAFDETALIRFFVKFLRYATHQRDEAIEQPLDLLNQTIFLLGPLRAPLAKS